MLLELRAQGDALFGGGGIEIRGAHQRGKKVILGQLEKARRVGRERLRTTQGDERRRVVAVDEARLHRAEPIPAAGQAEQRVVGAGATAIVQRARVG